MGISIKELFTLEEYGYVGITLVFFLVIVPGFGIMIHGNSVLAALEFVAGVFFGSTVWWILLCGSVGKVRTRISGDNLKMINPLVFLIFSL